MKIPDSISAMVYSMKYPYLWTLMIWIIAAVGYFLMTSKSESLIPLAFATSGSIAFVGCMPLIKNENNILHWICGIIGCALSQVWCILTAGFIPILLWWVAYCIMLILTKQTSKWSFWLEMWCIGSVVGIYLI